MLILICAETCKPLTAVKPCSAEKPSRLCKVLGTIKYCNKLSKGDRGTPCLLLSIPVGQPAAAAFTRNCSFRPALLITSSIAASG